MREISNIVILTGAGVSAESGVATFRGPDGLWEGHRVEDVATPEAFERDPALVHAFYDARRAKLDTVAPNAAHVALAKLERRWPGEFLLVTQNVDSLHEQAGSQKLIHMHGQHNQALCNACGGRSAWEDEMSLESRCPACEQTGHMPYQMERIQAALAACDLFVSIGTSGNVYPAAGFVREAQAAGARTVELNLEPSAGAAHFDETDHGPATRVVPDFVERLLSGRGR